MISRTEKCDIEYAKNTPLTLLKAKDNYDEPTNFFINNNKAKELQQTIEQYKSEVRQLLPEKIQNTFDLGLVVDGEYQNANNEKEDWATHNFFHTILAADVTILNKLVMDVHNTEYSVVNYLYSNISEENFKFDKIDVKIIPQSNYIFVGDKYEADVLVVAYDTAQSPTAYIKVGADKVSEKEISSATPFKATNGNGLVHISLPSSREGINKFAGLLQMQSPTGEINTYHFSDQFIVARPSMNVSATKMNVFYAGIPNPVTISAPVASEQLRINWGGCSATSLGNGRYDVTVPQNMAGKTVNVTVSADMGGGKAQNMGSTEFRIKPVPEPTASIGSNITSGRQPKDLLLANPLIVARMSPDFNYELRWNVVSYKVTFVRNNVEEAPITVKGGRFPDNVVSKIRSASSGTQMEISEIKVQSIAGARTLKTILVRIK